jgi:hypothetical protein
MVQSNSISENGRNNGPRSYSTKQPTKQRIIKIVLVVVLLAILVVVIRVVRYTKKNLPPSTAVLPVPTEYLEPKKEVSP